MLKKNLPRHRANLDRLRLLAGAEAASRLGQLLDERGEAAAAGGGGGRGRKGRDHTCDVRSESPAEGATSPRPSDRDV